jgi:hypothetical protein
MNINLHKGFSQNNIIMRLPITLIIVFFLSNFSTANNPGKDFLITLNGSKLTGNIKEVSYSNGKSQIYFENDFGNTYVVLPATIYGFAFDENGTTTMYESKYLNGDWQFLKVEKRGEALSLYTSSERQLQFTNTNESPIVVEEKNPQIWLQFKEEQPFKIYRLTFRSTLRKKMEDFPDLAKNIGKRGFRYKNLSKIVELYNKFHSKNGKS